MSLYPCSVQMFHKTVKLARQGDRLGMCLAGFDAKLLERGVACTPGSVPTIPSAVALVRKIRYYKSPVKSGTKMHVTIGHSTILATVTFFGHKELSSYLHTEEKRRRSDSGDASEATQLRQQQKQSTTPPSFMCCVDGLPDNVPFDWKRDYMWQDEIVKEDGLEKESMGYGHLAEGRNTGRRRNREGVGGSLSESVQTNGGRSIATENLSSVANETNFSVVQERQGLQWALLQFDVPLCTPLNALLIASRLDTDVNTTSCRMAFYGRLVRNFDMEANRRVQGARGGRPLYEEGLERLRLFKMKQRAGLVTRLGNMAAVSTSSCPRSSGPGVGGGERRYHDVLGKDLFKRETDMKQFIGRKVITEFGGYVGTIESAFGQSGKFKVVFKESENEKRSGVPVRVGERLVLQFKRYIYDGDKRMHQDDETMVLSPAWLAKNRSNVKEKGRPLGGGGINSKSSPVRLKNVEVIAETSDGSSDVDNGVQIGHFNSLRSSAVPFNPPVKPLRARPSYSEPILKHSPFSGRSLVASDDSTASRMPSSPARPAIGATTVNVEANKDINAGNLSTPERKRTGTVSKLKKTNPAISELVIADGLFMPSEDIGRFEGLVVALTLPGGSVAEGIIEGAFGKAGKCRVAFEAGTGVVVGMPLSFIKGY